MRKVKASDPERERLATEGRLRALLEDDKVLHRVLAVVEREIQKGLGICRKASRSLSREDSSELHRVSEAESSLKRMLIVVGGIKPLTTPRGIEAREDTLRQREKRAARAAFLKERAQRRKAQFEGALNGTEE